MGRKRAPLKFPESRRDVMWVSRGEKYPHFVPTGLENLRGLPVSTHVSPLAGLGALRKIESSLFRKWVSFWQPKMLPFLHLVPSQTYLKCTPLSGGGGWWILQGIQYQQKRLKTERFCHNPAVAYEPPTPGRQGRLVLKKYDL